MTHLMIADYDQNPNIGLFCYANNKYCLVPRGFSEKLKNEFSQILNVPVYEVNAAGTSLLGVFFSGNDDVLLVPEIMFEGELRTLDEYKIKYKIVKTELTALGNNMIFLGNAGIINPDYSDSVLTSLEKIGLKVKKGKISGLSIVGSLAKGNDKGLLTSPDIEELEMKFIKDTLKIKITTGTLNFGSPYVSSGMICNSHGLIVGDSSGGPEIQNADEALGFL